MENYPIYIHLYPLKKSAKVILFIQITPLNPNVYWLLKKLIAFLYTHTFIIYSHCI